MSEGPYRAVGAVLCAAQCRYLHPPARPQTQVRVISRGHRGLLIHRSGVRFPSGLPVLRADAWTESIALQDLPRLGRRLRYARLRSGALELGLACLPPAYPFAAMRSVSGRTSAGCIQRRDPHCTTLVHRPLPQPHRPLPPHHERSPRPLHGRTGSQGREAGSPSGG